MEIDTQTLMIFVSAMTVAIAAVMAYAKQRVENQAQEWRDRTEKALQHSNSIIADMQSRAIAIRAAQEQVRTEQARAQAFPPADWLVVPHGDLEITVRKAGGVDSPALNIDIEAGDPEPFRRPRRPVDRSLSRERSDANS